MLFFAFDISAICFIALFFDRDTLSTSAFQRFSSPRRHFFHFFATLFLRQIRHYSRFDTPLPMIALIIAAFALLLIIAATPFAFFSLLFMPPY